MRYSDAGEQRMFLNGEDVSADTQSGDIHLRLRRGGASRRARLLMELQRRMARDEQRHHGRARYRHRRPPGRGAQGVPHGSAEARAQRRLLELEHKGVAVSFAEVLRDIEYRDEQDTSRAAAPLKRAEDAVLLDTSSIDFDESLSALSDIITRRLGVKAVDAE